MKNNSKILPPPSLEPSPANLIFRIISGEWEGGRHMCSFSFRFNGPSFLSVFLLLLKMKNTTSKRGGATRDMQRSLRKKKHIESKTFGDLVRWFAAKQTTRIWSQELRRWKERTDSYHCPLTSTCVPSPTTHILCVLDFQVQTVLSPASLPAVNLASPQM